MQLSLERTLAMDYVFGMHLQDVIQLLHSAIEKIKSVGRFGNRILVLQTRLSGFDFDLLFKFKTVAKSHIFCVCTLITTSLFGINMENEFFEFKS